MDSNQQDRNTNGEKRGKGPRMPTDINSLGVDCGDKQTMVDRPVLQNLPFGSMEQVHFFLRDK